MKVRFTTPCPPIVPTGQVHPRYFHPGDETADPYVCEVAMRNGWGVDVDAAPVDRATNATAAAAAAALAMPASDAAAADATAAAAAAALAMPASDAAAADAPAPRKARKAAPENK